MMSSVELWLVTDLQHVIIKTINNLFVRNIIVENNHLTVHGVFNRNQVHKRNINHSCAESPGKLSGHHSEVRSTGQKKHSKFAL